MPFDSKDPFGISGKQYQLTQPLSMAVRRYLQRGLRPIKCLLENGHARSFRGERVFILAVTPGFTPLLPLLPLATSLTKFSRKFAAARILPIRLADRPYCSANANYQGESTDDVEYRGS